ncbi:MAG: diguanylate cyclase [Acidaminococcaceae bacterium]
MDKPESSFMQVFKHVKTLSITFVVTFLVLICAYAIFEKRDVDTDRAFLAREHEIFISSQKRLIANELNERVSDLLYLEENAVFKNYITGKGSKEDLENEWLLFVSKMKKYDQIRYIDAKGNEKVRINFNDGKPAIVEQGSLENKKDRQYFIKSIKLDDRSIYRSPLDLNVENGKIEEPVKPTLRFGVPVFDQDGTKCGIVVLNYFGRYVIDNIKRANQEINYMQLVNEKGYWLAGPDPKDEWSFMYTAKSEDTFANNFPDEWARITTEKNGQFFGPMGLFTFRMIEPDVEARTKLVGTNDEDIAIKGADGAWFLISHVPVEVIPYANDENGYLIGLKRLFGLPSLLLTITFAACVFTILFSLYRAENEKLKEIASHDLMTGCLTRRAGVRILENTLKNSERNKKPLSMLLLDIDHFKRVNDNWGHLMGDKVLKRVAKIVKAEVRDKDSVIRTGGEEFVVLLPDTDAENAVLIAERLRISIESFLHPSVGKVTASFGVAEKRKEDNRITWYKRVDDALYHAKETGRNRVFNADDLDKKFPLATVQIEWKSEWESGNEKIDKQHRELVRFGNELIFDVFSDETKEKIEPKLDEFLNHVIFHFNSEDEILNSTKFAGAKEHSEAHKLIIADALRMKEAYLSGKLKPSAFFSFIFDDFIVGHMIKEDAKYFPFVQDNS